MAILKVAVSRGPYVPYTYSTLESCNNEQHYLVKTYSNIPSYEGHFLVRFLKNHRKIINIFAYFQSFRKILFCV